MRVYVLNMRGQPLMPTTPRKARVLLRDGKAKVVKRTPFTIQLTIATGETKQPITLGVDAGSKTIGLSASTEDEELFSSEVIIRNDIVDLIATRKQYRRTRRNRLRYRPVRFNNRNVSRGWFAPSIRNKIDAHLRVIENIHRILPVTHIIVEVASFDIQKIQNPNIQGKEYQEGDQLGFWNVREYVLFRDGHKCKGKKNCKGTILNVHHIESRKIGGDSPGNLITLCEKCHKAYHNSTLKLNLKREKSFKDATFMGIMRWSFYEKLKELYNNVSLTYGYITKNMRIQSGLPKEHRIDAYCIANNMRSKQSNMWYMQKQIRKHNRQIHKAKILHENKKQLNQCPYELFGFRLYDKVKFNQTEYFIISRRRAGCFILCNSFLDKTDKINVNYRKIKTLEKAKTYLWKVCLQ